jgi:BON domain-containing protein
MRTFWIAIGLLAANMAYAQPRADFAALDANGDGYLSRLEAAADPEIAKRFPLFDFDRDWRLSEREFLLARQDHQRRVLSDLALVARIKAALQAERGIPLRTISVETYEGRVQLSGFVAIAESASRAGRVAANVDGVRTVHNNIVVR